MKSNSISILSLILIFFLTACGPSNTQRRRAVEYHATNNLRQISFAADRCFLEKNVSEVKVEDLIPEYLPRLTPVDGERYPEMIKANDEILVAHLKDGTTVLYER